MRRLLFQPFAAAMVMATQLAGCASSPPARLTQSPGRFTACSSAPHCVSSQADRNDKHYVRPFTYRGDAAHARQTLLQILRAQHNAKIARADDRFIHATFHTTLGFVDDMTFIIQPRSDTIDVKSSSRIGYYDFGVNRRRVERLRSAFAARLQSE